MVVTQLPAVVVGVGVALAQAELEEMLLELLLVQEQQITVVMVDPGLVLQQQVIPEVLTVGLGGGLIDLVLLRLVVQGLMVL
jgi:hypothetical protein